MTGGVSDQSAEQDAVTMADLLTELRAIRGLLEQQVEGRATCPHGATGLCMACITPLIEFHAGDLVRQLSNQAWEASRRG
jgi:hypothetical protein